MKSTLSERYCVRCKAEVFGEPGSHLCADLAKRLARRERQVNEVERILAFHMRHGDASVEGVRLVAEGIVKVLANLGVEND